MIISEETAKALEAKDLEAATKALEKDYPGAGEYLAKKLLGIVKDKNIIV